MVSQGVEEPDCLVKKGVSGLAGSGSAIAILPARRQQLEQGIIWIAVVLDDLE